MDTDDLRALIAVIEHGSTQAAAEATRASRSTLRRRLENLEAEVGVPLLVRGAAGAAPTPAGLALAERGRALVAEVAAMVAATRELRAEPEGLLRGLVPVGLPTHLMALVFAVLRERMPRVEFRCTIADDPLRELHDEVELVLHFGPPPARGSWISTVLARTPERLLASPLYLQERGAPASLDDLAQHTLLSWRAPGEEGRRWPLIAGGWWPVSPVFVCPDAHLVRQIAASGQGIALLPEGGVPEAPDMPGELVPVLPALVGRDNALRAMVPEALAGLPKGRAVLGAIRELVAGLQG